MTLLIRPAQSRPQFEAPQHITVRRASIADAPALERIYRQTTVLENTAQEPLASVEGIGAWIAGIGAEGHLLLACAEGDLAGALLLQQMANPGLRHVGQLARVAVDEARRGRGVGSRLVAAAIDLADNWLNLFRLELLVRADNPSAVALYRKYGFRDEGLLQGYGYRNGSYIDCLAMARFRGPLAR